MRAVVGVNHQWEQRHRHSHRNKCVFEMHVAGGIVLIEVLRAVVRATDLGREVEGATDLDREVEPGKI